jgi:hypothetical protein
VEWFTTGHGTSLRERREARAALAEVLTRVGGARRLVITAPPGLLAWQLRLPTGRAETAGSFPDLLDSFVAAWGEPVDPLDERVVEQVTRGTA